MKLIRYGAARHEKPGIIHNDRWLDVSEYFEDYNEAFFENDGLTKLESLIAGKSHDLKEIEELPHCILLKKMILSRYQPPKPSLLPFTKTTSPTRPAPGCSSCWL